MLGEAVWEALLFRKLGERRDVPAFRAGDHRRNLSIGSELPHTVMSSKQSGLRLAWTGILPHGEHTCFS
jgi:hypothetical protein